MNSINLSASDSANSRNSRINATRSSEILELIEDIIRHPAESFTIKVKGDSMVDAGIYDGDLLAVDCSLEPHNGAVVVATLDGDLLVKRLKLRNGKTILLSENKNYPPLDVTDYLTFRVLGVVTGLIRKM